MRISAAPFVDGLANAGSTMSIWKQKADIAAFRTSGTKRAWILLSDLQGIFFGTTGYNHTSSDYMLIALTTTMQGWFQVVVKLNYNTECVQIKIMVRNGRHSQATEGSGFAEYSPTRPNFCLLGRGLALEEFHAWHYRKRCGAASASADTISAAAL